MISGWFVVWKCLDSQRGDTRTIGGYKWLYLTTQPFIQEVQARARCCKWVDLVASPTVWYPVIVVEMWRCLELSFPFHRFSHRFDPQASEEDATKVWRGSSQDPGGAFGLCLLYESIRSWAIVRWRAEPWPGTWEMDPANGGLVDAFGVSPIDHFDIFRWSVLLNVFPNFLMFFCTSASASLPCHWFCVLLDTPLGHYHLRF